MLTKPFKPLALAFLVNLIISVEDKIKYKVIIKKLSCNLSSQVINMAKNMIF